MAKTKTSGVSMTNAWLAEQGVLSLKSLWAELAHLRETAQCSPAYRAGEVETYFAVVKSPRGMNTQSIHHSAQEMTVHQTS